MGPRQLQATAGAPDVRLDAAVLRRTALDPAALLVRADEPDHVRCELRLDAGQLPPAQPEPVRAHGGAVGPALTGSHAGVPGDRLPGRLHPQQATGPYPDAAADRRHDPV